MKRIFKNDCAPCDLRSFSPNGNNVFYVQNEATLCCDVYVTSSDFGSFYNGDKMVRRAGDRTVFRIVKVRTENDEIEYFLTDNSRNVVLGKAKKGIPSLNRADCPKAPFFQAMMCASYYRLANKVGLDEAGLKTYINAYNSCMASNVKNQVVSKAKAGAKTIDTSEIMVGDLGKTATENSAKTSKIQQQK